MCHTSSRSPAGELDRRGHLERSSLWAQVEHLRPRLSGKKGSQMLANFNFLTHETLRSYTISDTVDGYRICHTKPDASVCELTPESDYFINGFQLLELILAHQQECGK